MVIEQGGAGIMSGVQRSNPFRKPNCRWEEDCMVDNSKFDCMETGCVYKIFCNRCSQNVQESRERYHGQSGRSMHARQEEHAKGLLKGCTNCPLVRHNREQHTGVNLKPKDFTMVKVMGTRDNMTHLI